jgi:hypothetical protein
MKCMSFIRAAAVALATLGIAIPQAPVMAAGSKATAKPSVKMVAENTIFDIELTSGGTFTGRVVDHTGAALEGAEVVISQGKTPVARTITDKQGTFVVTNMKGGVYTASSGVTGGTYRLWAENTAPPAAKEQGLLVLGQNGARGQCGATECCAGGGHSVLLAAAVGAVAIAALVVGIVALDKANDAFVSP